MRTAVTLTDLRSQWRTKHDEANALVRKDTPTGPDLTQAEKLFDERDQIQTQIDELLSGQRKQADLRSRADVGQAWDSEPAPSPASSPSFKTVGWEEAGYVKYNTETKRIMEEVGPGQFGKKTWDLLRSVEYKRDFVHYLRKGQRALDLHTKTLQEAIDDQGGVLVPADMILQILGRKPAPTRLRALVKTIPTGRDVVTMPRKQYSADDKYTTAFRATWTGELPSADPDVDDTNLLGEIEIPVHTAMLSAPVSKNMLEDSAFPVQSWLEDELSQTIELLYEDMILNGTGIAQPAGCLSNPGATNRPEVVLSGAADTLAVDGLLNLVYSLPEQYDDNSRFVLNRKSGMKTIAKLKDASNRMVFLPVDARNEGIAAARPGTILGYPITLSAFMPDVGNGAYPVLFGDFLGYYLPQRIGFSIEILRETKAKRNQVELVGRCRFGGQPAEHWRLKLQKSDDA